VKRLGRPPLGERGAKDQMQVRLVSGRKRAYRKAANGNGLKLSQWVVKVCDGESGYQPEVFP